jgi:hypothetical protein
MSEKLSKNPLGSSELFLLPRAIVILVLLVTFFVSFAAGVSAQAHDQVVIPKALPYQNGWLGGDVGTSLNLPDGRTFWIFGDTFIDKLNRSPEAGGNREESTFIHNSIGISESRLGKFKIEYHWKHDDIAGRARSFFFSELENGSESEPATYFWPLSLFFFHDQIFVLLSRTQSSKANPLGFTNSGVDLARIANWREKPERWKIEHIRLSDSPDVHPSAAAVTDGPWLYLFADLNLQGLGQVDALARIAFKDLLRNDLRHSLQYLKNDGSYSGLGKIQDLKIVLPSGNTELSVFQSNKKWYLVQMIKNRVLELMLKAQDPTAEITLRPDQIVLQTADQLSGPWSAPKVIYTPPETDPASSKFDAMAFSYAAKVHFGFARSANLSFALTYVVNTTDAKAIFSDLNLYRPVTP